MSTGAAVTQSGVLKTQSLSWLLDVGSDVAVPLNTHQCGDITTVS